MIWHVRLHHHYQKVHISETLIEYSMYMVSQKNVLLWKNSHNYLQIHQKCKSWGCFGKFRIFALTWALRFSKLNKKWLRKWSLKLPTPLQKSAEFTAHIIHSFDDPLHFHDLQWNQNLFHTLVESKVKVVLYPWPDVSSSRTIMPYRMAERINQMYI